MRQIIPVLYQFSWIITLPLTVTVWSWHTLWVIPLALVWHWLSFSLTGHMIISHQQKSRWIPDIILKICFFINCYISPSLWAGYHIQHHKHTDTVSDPQSRDHLGLKPLIATYDPELCDLRTYVRSEKNYINHFFTRYYWLGVIMAVTVATTTPVWSGLLWLVPGSIAFNIALLSAWYTHKNSEPLSDMPAVMNVLFSGESRYHAQHHADWNHCEPVTKLMLQS